MKTLKSKIDESLIKSYDTNKLCDKIKSKYKDIKVNIGENLNVMPAPWRQK